MTNFNVSRMRNAGVWRAAFALAWGPLAALACSVYEEPLAAGTGGTGSASGNATAGASAGSSNDVGGSAGTSGGGASAGSGAGTSGTFAGGGAGGSEVGGSSHGGTESAGTDAGGQPTGDPVLVDDMEDTDQQIALADGRNGFWYVGNDLTPGGVQEPPSTAFAMFELTAGDNGDSLYSAHMKASGWTSWGSVIGFNLVESGGVKAYDASEYCGVTFSAKAAAATALHFRLPDGDTHPGGKVCVETGAANQLCYDHFNTPVTLSTAWKPYTIMFTQLTQTGTGYHPADKKFKADQLYAVEWALPGAAGKAYEIWIDDVKFLACP